MLAKSPGFIHVSVGLKADLVNSFAPCLVVRASSSTEDRQLVAGWLEAEHFLGALRPVGHTLMQFVQQESQILAVLVWAASAYHLKPIFNTAKM